MPKLKFEQAQLYLGTGPTNIPNDSITPFGDWDTDVDVDSQAFHSMAVMSQASGGKQMSKAVFSIHPDGYATLFGNGFRIVWGTRPALPDTASPQDKADFHEKMIQAMRVESIKFNVVSDKYYESWKRAERFYPKTTPSAIED